MTVLVTMAFVPFLYWSLTITSRHQAARPNIHLKVAILHPNIHFGLSLPNLTFTYRVVIPSPRHGAEDKFEA